MTAAERAALLAEAEAMVHDLTEEGEAHVPDVLSRLAAEVRALEAVVERLWDELAKADAAVLAMRGTGQALAAHCNCDRPGHPEIPAPMSRAKCRRVRRLGVRVSVDAKWSDSTSVFVESRGHGLHVHICVYEGPGHCAAARRHAAELIRALRFDGRSKVGE